MIAASFEYDAPSTLEDAIGLLRQYGDEAKNFIRWTQPFTYDEIPVCFAGKTNRYQRYPWAFLCQGRRRPVEDRRIDKRSRDRTFRIIEKKFPIFGDVTKLIADPQVRNRGTVGGNLAHGDAA